MCTWWEKCIYSAQHIGPALISRAGVDSYELVPSKDFEIVTTGIEDAHVDLVAVAKASKGKSMWLFY